MNKPYDGLMELEIFNETDNQGVSDISIQLAATILMFEVSRADGDVDSIEVAEMIEILKNQFSLNSDEVVRLISTGRATTSEEIHLETYTSLLCAHWGQKERARLLNDFWLLALSDLEIDQGERELIEKIARLLKLDEDEIERARIHAEHVLELSTN